MLLLFRNRGGGGDFPPGFNPLTDYWWDGSDPATMWQNTAKTTAVGPGDPVRVWTSKGVALDAIAPSDPERATWNGTDRLTFVANLSRSAGNSYNATPVPAPGSAVTALAVLQGSGAAAIDRDGHWRLGDTNNAHWPNAALGQLFDLAASTTRRGPSSAIGSTERGVYIVVSAVDWGAYWNGAQVLYDPVNTVVLPVLGIGQSTPVRHFDGTFSAVYIKPNYAANAAERAALETWFAAKYGVVLP